LTKDESILKNVIINNIKVEKTNGRFIADNRDNNKASIESDETQPRPRSTINTQQSMPHGDYVELPVYDIFQRAIGTKQQSNQAISQAILRHQELQQRSDKDLKSILNKSQSQMTLNIVSERERTYGQPFTK